MVKISSKIKVIRERKKINKRKRLHQNKILILGGFGYHNVGDEAQLAAVLERLTRLFPNSLVKVLSPNPDNTFLEHEKCFVDYAPRVSFFKENESLLYSIRDNSQYNNASMKLLNMLLKFLFLVKSRWIELNAFFEKRGLPVMFISSQAAGLLYDIRSSQMIYFEGGGYLTGTTLSRFWDGILVCRLAKMFDIPVVMSGQTIGVWKTKFNETYARSAFRSVKIITLRDVDKSINDLRKLHIDMQHIYPVCDDALFCDKGSNLEKEKVFIDSHISIEDVKLGYIVENIHDWGIEENLNDILAKIYKFNLLIKEIMDLKIIFIPMTPSDEATMIKYNEKFAEESIPIFKYSYDYKIIRKIISDSQYCFTMKHHPIIFSVGEKTPCIAWNYSDYYIHKNCGALDILGMSDYFVNLEDEKCYEKLRALIIRLKNNRQDIVEVIEKKLEEKKEIVKLFEKDLVDVMEKRL